MIPLLLTLAFVALAYKICERHFEHLQGTPHQQLSALPKFYGYVAGTFMLGTLGLFWTVWALVGGDGETRGRGLFFCLIVASLTLGGVRWILKPSLRARHIVERWGRGLFIGAAFISVGITSALVLLLLKESAHFFSLVPLSDFLFGTVWAPEISHGTQAPLGHYGALPLVSGTFLITFVALCTGGFLGLMVALYTSQFAKPLTRTFLKPALEILAGIPTIVYGFFALAVVAPGLHHLGEWLHIPISSESALGAGLVMGFMIAPIISSLSDDALRSLPRALKQNALAMGATSTEAIRTVLIPAAFPGITASFLLAISRATGETILVLMAASLQPNLTGNPLEAVTTVTVQIVSLLTGDQAFESAKTLSAFALALVLFLMTLFLNILALFLVNRHAKRYEL